MNLTKTEEFMVYGEAPNSLARVFSRQSHIHTRIGFRTQPGVVYHFRTFRGMRTVGFGYNKCSDQVFFFLVFAGSGA